MPAKKQTSSDDLTWYKNAIIYELHIKAFFDCNDDGVGDIQGLISKLDYLHDLGITAIWLLPFYPSPLRDDGYDIADYYQINSAYGTIKHFKKFLSEAHKRNLKVITELVVNHTSDQHPWFQRARKAPRDSPEHSFYVWTDNPHQYRDVRIIFQDFETSNWTWDPVAQQYYWHRFFHHQPDLNYDNPLVQKEIFKMIDYWCNIGVDGFRLDAVPYLFEREGTNGENLPETHAFLKKLRRHVDKKYPGTLLLAEANMWPEDSASYFGNGDECHMNYHFPVMPRMFMALQMEDRYPITDIFDQTPAIPDNCQWAIFLRNHDELTLEMVTDEERDYMYRAYTKDPKARINLGIRHRLAPLLENNRRKIELLNYLLFSLPGTPVIYYGDEIGMGDNFYLGDRDGVRTPMQWNSDRNAGFSRVNPQKLYLPVILDPDYHYESTNVEIQLRNTSSLLWWMKRMISARKKYKAFGRGDMQFIETENPKILSFTRTYEEEIMLVIVNLSRYTQPFELLLGNYEGYVPVEVFSRNKFPVIRDQPYFLTMAPYECLWFRLENAQNEHKKTLPVIRVSKWEQLPESGAATILENEILPEYLLKVRWFGGKSRVVESVEISDHIFIPHKSSGTHLILVKVNYQSGLPEVYQLPLGYTDSLSAEKIREASPNALIASIRINDTEGVLYDAIYGLDFQEEIIRRMASHQSSPNHYSEIVFQGNKQVREYVHQQEIKSRVLSGEQSNTSVVYGNAFFFKLYRKIDRVINPDVEITRFFTEHTEFRNTPLLAGTVEWKYRKDTIILGMMQEMVSNGNDAWSYMLDQIRHYYEKVLSAGQPALPAKSPGLSKTRDEIAIPSDLQQLITIPVIEYIKLIGVRTAEMHMALASHPDIPEFKPEEFSLHYQRSLYSSFQSLVRVTLQNLSKGMKRLPDELRPQAESILSGRQDMLTVFKRIYRKKLQAVKTRIHGDYHLGQLLFTGKDLVILDFEGEPARPYSERRLKRSPLRDVAGMVRSFHYAAYAALLLDDHLSAADKQKLIPFAEQWYAQMSALFFRSYLHTVNGSSFIPEDEEELKMMLETYILEKAIYELNYELNNRPEWSIIPMNGIQAIMKDHLK